MKISAIIPTLNESENIGKLIEQLRTHGGDQLLEIIVVDGGSTDHTVEIAEHLEVKVLSSPKRSRASQMNLGASAAKGDVFYFIHADTLPPDCYMTSMVKALEHGFPIGCFRYQFNSNKRILKINAYFTRFSMLWCRGGDQSLFIKKVLFENMNGFREDYQIMEDFEFILRARKKYPFKIIQKDMLVSARKYEENSYLRVQMANLLVFNMFRLGYSQEAMVRMYRKLLRAVKN